jgi:uncharacterized protein
MDRTAYINLPVQDLARSVEFFTALGFAFDPRIGDENTQCMVIGSGALAMLHTTAFFEQFTSAAVADPATKEVAVSLTAASNDEVDELVERAIAAGGKDAGQQDMGFMYMRAFLDLDGHRWSFMHFAH